MLVSKEGSLRQHGYHLRRQWLEDDFLPNDYSVAGTVWVYTFLYEDKAWEIGFREGDWGDTIKLWRPNRNNHGTD